MNKTTALWSILVVASLILADSGSGLFTPSTRGPEVASRRGSKRRRSASGSSFVDVGPGHKTRAPRSAARTPRRRGTPTIDDYYAKYSRSTAERLYEHDNATRRTFDEAARHAEALFAAHDMSPARD